jgi:hypothetical protein
MRSIQAPLSGGHARTQSTCTRIRHLRPRTAGRRFLREVSGLLRSAGAASAALLCDVAGVDAGVTKALEVDKDRIIKVTKDFRFVELGRDPTHTGFRAPLVVAGHTASVSDSQARTGIAIPSPHFAELGWSICGAERRRTPAADGECRPARSTQSSETHRHQLPSDCGKTKW